MNPQYPMGQQRPQQAPPLTFQDLMGLFSMMNGQQNQGLQTVNQLQQFQNQQTENAQQQMEQPYRQQILENQARAPQVLQQRQEYQDKQAQTAMILDALRGIQPTGLGETGGNQAAILDALRQKFGFNPAAPTAAAPTDPAAAMAAFQAQFQ